MADASNPWAISEDTAAGSNIGSGIGDLIGYFMAAGDRDKARELIDQATALYAGLNPNVTVGTEGVVRQGGTEYDRLDPTARINQLAALDQLKQVWSNQGLDPIARAQNAEAAAATEQEANALNNSLMQDAAQRGMADSGTTMAARRSNAQAAANRAAQQNAQAAAAGQMRSMNALGTYLGGAGQVRQQDADRALAQDAINRFNAANEQAVSGRNIDRGIEGQEASFAQGMQRAGGVSGQAGAYRTMAQDTQRTAHNIGGGIGGGLGAAAGAAGVAASDERLKVKVARESEEALPGVPFATWEWPDQPGVRHRGVIAQDLEKVAPQYVLTRGDGVKFVDYSFLDEGRA